jgi:hypothetical protein
MMLLQLWLPILVTTVVLFFTSFLAWVVLPHHKPDVRRWPSEDALLDFIRSSGGQPGEYLFPLIDEKDMKEDWAKKRYADGPWGMVNVWAQQPNMGLNMVKTVLFFLVVSILVGYVGASGAAGRRQLRRGLSNRRHYRHSGPLRRWRLPRNLVHPPVARQADGFSRRPRFRGSYRPGFRAVVAMMGMACPGHLPQPSACDNS